MTDDYHNKDGEPRIFIHVPPNEQPFAVVYAFLSVDEHGNEGIVGLPGPDGRPMPLVFGHPRMIERARQIVRELARVGGRKIRLVRYQTKSVLEEFEP